MLDVFESQLSALIANLDAGSRRQLAREIVSRLRISQQKRIAAQQNPDGSLYAPRKPSALRGKKGYIKRKMFQKLRTSRYLKTESSPNEAIVRFAGMVERIAQVHQLGLRDRVNRTGQGPEIQYPARELLGFSVEDLSAIDELVLHHLAR